MPSDHHIKADAEILIVGADVAGLYAADRLQQADIRFHVHEARDRGSRLTAIGMECDHALFKM